MNIIKGVSKGFETIIEFSIFASRWFQAPIYLGLIILDPANKINGMAANPENNNSTPK